MKFYKGYQTLLHYLFFSALFVIFLLFNNRLAAQTKPKEINYQTQTWLSLNNTIRLSDKWSAIVDVHMRRNHFASDPSFYFIRFGAGYTLNSSTSIAAGYGHLWLAPTTPGYTTFADENRIYEQIQTSAKTGNVNIINRLRIEQRWQEKVVKDTSTHTNKFTNRFRYTLTVNIPLSKKPHVPSLLISDEINLQVGKEVVYNTFDQNRAFVGIKETINPHLSFDLGYMMVFQEKANGYQYDFNNTYRCFFYYTPDIRKKKS
jgi:hypothetical protein